MPTPGKTTLALYLSALAVAAVLAGCTSQTPDTLLASGNELAAKKDYAGAVIQFKSALQLAPESAQARLGLGNALLEQGDVKGAIAEFKKAQDQKAPAAAVVPQLSRALIMAGDYRQLVVAYGDLTLDDKTAQATLKSNVATAWGALGDRAKTEAAVSAALQAMPDHGPALVTRARILAGQGKADEAVRLVDEVLARQGGYQDAWLLRGEIFDYFKRDAKAAQEAYRKALAGDASYVPAHAALVYSMVRQRDLAGAKRQADALRMAVPGHPYGLLVDAHLAFLDKQPARARELTQQLLRLFPDNAGILMLAGAVESELGAVVQAAAYFGKVVQLNPSYGQARRSLAATEIRLGQYARALETLAPELAADAPSAQSLSLAGDAELRLGNAQAAERHFLRAARIDPADTRLQAAAAVAKLSTRGGAEALAELQGLAAKTKDTFADEALFAAHFKRGELDAALRTLDSMVRKQPGTSGHEEMRGRVHLARGDIAAARRAFEEALKLDPGRFAAVGSLAALDIQEGRREQAVARLQARVDAEPKNWVALMALAEMKARQGAPVDEVKRLYAAAIDAEPTAVEPRVGLLDFNLRSRQFKDALTVAQAALAAHPDDARMLEPAGRAQFQSGDTEQAARTFRRLATARPKSPEPYLQLAEVYRAGGKRDQAEVAIKKALELAPDSVVAHTALLDLQMGSGRQQEALENIRRIQRSRDKSDLGYALEAMYHGRRRDTDAALSALQDGLAKTGSPALAAKVYTLLWRSRRLAEAQKFATGWTRQHPDDLSFEYMLSMTDIAQHNFPLAERRLKRVLAGSPNNVMALNNIAWVMVQTGGKGAVAYAQRAVDLAPDRPPYMDTLALALAAENRTGEALAVQKRAVGLEPKDNGLRLNLARILIQAGDKTLAREELLGLQKLGTAFTGHEEVERLLRSL